MNVYRHYRVLLSWWRREHGSMFPKLAEKTRRVLANPDATETDLAEMIGEINRSGAPTIGTYDKPDNRDQGKAQEGSRKETSVNQCMAAMLLKDSTRVNWSANKWATVVTRQLKRAKPLSDAAVKQTATWDTIMDTRAMTKADRANRDQRGSLRPMDEAAIREYVEKASPEEKAWFLELSPQKQIDFLNEREE